MSGGILERAEGCVCAPVCVDTDGRETRKEGGGFE